MSQKMYLNILRIGIYASFVCILFVFKNLLFPYITSKQIPFNIIVEVLFVFWIAFLVKYPEYKPKKSYITFGLVAFFSAITISSLFGVDFNLSFWGDVERMLGVFHILHFFIFYLIIVTVFREWKDWKYLFIVSIIISFIVTLNGQGPGDSGKYSTIGNVAYVSAYIIFNLFFSVLLFSKEKNQILKWLYLIPVPFWLVHFKNLSTTGALVGLGFSILVGMFLYVLLLNNKKHKQIALSIFVVLIIFAGLILVNKDTEFVKNNSVLRIFNEISLQKNTFQTRLISWKAAFQDFHNHPVLGNGFGNYAITFDKYFDPTFYGHTRSETYFDRAHNNVIDIMTTSGLLGVLSYLSIFVALAYYLIRGYHKKYINIHEFVIISSLVVAYFVQNLAIFDSFVTYMGLMVVLGYVYWLYSEGEESVFDEVREKFVKVEEKITKDRRFENKEIYALVFAGLFSFVIMQQFNIKPWQMLAGTIEGQKAWSMSGVDQTMVEYKKALSLNTVLDRDAITSMNRLFVTNSTAIQKLDPAKRMEYLDYNIEMAKKNVAYNPGDSLNQMMLAQLLNVAATYERNNQGRFEYYWQQSIEAINKSIEASPGRVTIYFQKAQILLTKGDKEGALDTLRYSVELNPAYYDSSCHLARTLKYFNETDEAVESYEQCISYGGAFMIDGTTMNDLIGKYTTDGNKELLIKLYQGKTRNSPKDAKSWIELAKLYAEQGENEKAISAAQKVIEVDPKSKAYADDFINSIK